MPFTEDRLNEIVEELKGTCQSLHGVLDDDEDEDDKDLNEHIDMEIFMCEECGWWCEISEGNTNPDGGGDICDDCHHAHDYAKEDEE